MSPQTKIDEAKQTDDDPIMKIPFSGGCACGAIRYECSAKPLLMLKCHCRDCQQFSGAGFAAAVLVPAKALRILQGTPKYFSPPSEMGEMHTRGFCGECGSRLFGVVNPDRPHIGLLAASMDDPSVFQPQMDIFVRDAQPWDLMDPDLPKYETYPPR